MQPKPLEPETSDREPPLTRRAIGIGAMLVVANAYWLTANWGTAGYATSQSFATIVSLYYNVVFTLLVVLGLNELLRRRCPERALTRRELLTVYAMLAVGSSVAGHDWLQILWPSITYPVWFATPENRWPELLRHIPDWLTIKDKAALADLYRGGSPFLTWEHVRLWIVPLLVWSGLMLVLAAMMLLMVLLVKERWTRHERLTYPVVQIPVAMAGEGGAFFRERLMWVGFLLAASIDLMNGLHALRPQVPGLGGALRDIPPPFATRPWSAVGHTAVAVYPFAVGMSFLIPLDLSFSIWSFYLFGKLTRVAGDALGATGDPAFPYIAEQSAGAWIALAAALLWGMRSYLQEMVGKALRPEKEPDGWLSPRRALGGLAVGYVLLVGFCRLAGVPVWIATAYLAVFFAFSLAITRVRAEVGPPAHDVPAHPPLVLVSLLGSERIGMPGLTLFTFLDSINRFYRCHPMPSLLEGMVLLSRGKGNTARLVGTLVLAAVVGTAASAWSHYTLAYRHGAAIFGEQWHCRYHFDQLASWSANPVGASVPAITAMAAGGAMTVCLMVLRRAFAGWPLHPAGYALSLSFCNTSWYWFSILIGWLLKLILMRVGGLRTYRRGTAFFMGVVVGEFAMGAIWSLIGIALGVPMYRFLF